MKYKILELAGKTKEGKTKFAEVLTFIDNNYNYSPAAFKNGNIYNKETENQGSARVFSFAKLNGFSEQDTLELFAEHYLSVLNDPQGSGHQNIRQFMASGWEGIEFEAEVLTEK